MSTLPQRPPRRQLGRRHVGKSDGALVVWSILCFIIFVAAGGTGAALVVAFIIWVVPAFWLTIIYLIARAGRRKCPACGRGVKVGITECRACGFDFAAAARSHA